VNWKLLLLACATVTIGPVGDAEPNNLPPDIPLAPIGNSVTPDAKPGSEGSVIDKPIYNPETKSYFEVHKVTRAESSGYIPDVSWIRAKELAQSRVFRGTRGRLAIVKTAETHKFIVNNLRPPSGSWIGLRLICNGRTLQWVTGDFWPLSAYANWGKVWNSHGAAPNGARIDCNTGAAYLPVHYWGAEGGYKWNANGTAKHFYYAIIEYPTGKP
jgi:hypothetical protein